MRVPWDAEPHQFDPLLERQDERLYFKALLSYKGTKPDKADSGTWRDHQRDERVLQNLAGKHKAFELYRRRYAVASSDWFK